MTAPVIDDNVVPEPGARRPPTMRDVAALADVSLKTVSRVVNGEAGVSERLAVRVHEAVRLLGYQPNLTASNLRRSDQKTGTIGLVLDDVANPFASALHRAIEDVAVPHGTLVFAGSSDGHPERESDVLRALTRRRVDGLIIVPSSRDVPGLSREPHVRVPVVFVDRRASFPDACTVTVDNRRGIDDAVGHLAAHGHRRIAFLGDLRTIWTATERYAGFVEGLSRRGLQLVPELVRQDLRGSDAAAAATGELLRLDEPPTALLTGQNLITIGAMTTLQELGLQHRTALVGFDDSPLFALTDPPVTVVAQDPVALGRTAAELLFARLEGEAAPPEDVVLPTSLVVRGSGERPPA